MTPFLFDISNSITHTLRMKQGRLKDANSSTHHATHTRTRMQAPPPGERANKTRIAATAQPEATRHAQGGMGKSIASRKPVQGKTVRKPSARTPFREPSS